MSEQDTWLGNESTGSSVGDNNTQTLETLREYLIGNNAKFRL